LDILDTAGQDEYLIPYAINEAQGFVVVYSIVDKDSFDAVDDLVHKIRTIKARAPIMVVGNKCDLDEQRVVTEMQVCTLLTSKLAILVLS